MRRLLFGSALALLATLNVAVPVASAPASSKSLTVKDSYFANYASNSLVPSGRAFTTRRGGIGSLSYAYGGIPLISVTSNSSVTLEASGDTSNGGRFTRLGITGEVSIVVNTTNPFSEVSVCFKNSAGKRGCGSLKSSARIAPVGEDVVIATQEGTVTVSSEDTFQQETIRTGHYSLFKKDGTYTKPAYVYSMVGYSTQAVSRGGRNHTLTYQAKTGWRFENCKETIQAVAGTTPRMYSPLYSCLLTPDLKGL